MNITIRVLFILMLMALRLPAQRSLNADEFLRMVKMNHPEAERAGLRVAQAEAQAVAARGVFDPALYASYDSKELGGKEYFEYMQGGMKWFTPLGAEVRAGYELNSGLLLNPESSVPTYGLWNAGITVPIGAGLLTDPRRAGARIADIRVTGAEREYDAAMNDLLLEAAGTYWYWVNVAAQTRVYADAVRAAEVRLRAVREAWRLGDFAAVDTLEAYLQWQTRLVSLADAEMKLRQAEAKLGFFLNGETFAPPVLDSVPRSRPDTALLSSSVAQNPNLVWYENKLAELTVERRLKAEYLRPKLNAKYDFLAKNPINSSTDFSLSSNYKIGLDFSIPIFLREARGNYRNAGLKIEEATVAREVKSLDLEAKRQSALAEIEQLRRQLDLYEQAVRSNRALLDAELTRFEMGESSLFLVNARETAWITSLLRRQDLRAAWEVSIMKLRWTVGDMGVE